MIIDLPFSLMKKNQINSSSFANDWIKNHKAIGPTNSYDHIAPAQKPNHSITCISLSMCLSIWFPDQQSCLFIKYNCASHTYPFRLLSPKLQTYLSVSVSKINNKLTAYLYTQVIATKLPIYPHKYFLAILQGSLQTCQHSYASPYPQIF